MNSNMYLLGNYFLDLIIIYFWPAISLCLLTQNNVSEKVDKNDAKKANVLLKLFGVSLMTALVLLWKDLTVDSLLYIASMPSTVQKNGILVGFVIITIIMICSFYYYVFSLSKNLIICYRLKKLRFILMGMHVISGLTLVPSLIIAEIYDNEIWIANIIVNYILMISVVIVSAFKLYASADGMFIGYNNIIVQKRLYKQDELRFIINKLDSNYSIENGEDRIVIKNPDQKWIRELAEAGLLEEI